MECENCGDNNKVDDNDKGHDDDNCFISESYIN
jgi:hypothetical protein